VAPLTLEAFGSVMSIGGSHEVAFLNTEQELFPKERTALMSTSIALLIYHLAGGSVDSSGTFVIPLNLERPWVLLVGVHAVFVWFYYRFSITSVDARKNLEEMHLAILRETLKARRFPSLGQVESAAKSFLETKPDLVEKIAMGAADEVASTYVRKVGKIEDLRITVQTYFARVRYVLNNCVLHHNNQDKRTLQPEFTLTIASSCLYNILVFQRGMVTRVVYSEVLVPIVLALIATFVAAFDFGRWLYPLKV